MSTFLELCQKTAEESGTIPNLGDPTTTEDQTGRLYRIIGWVREAYEDIQLHSSKWRWMNADFSGQTISGTQNYNASSLGITERFSRWLIAGPKGDNLFTVYKTADGQADEGHLDFWDWSRFRRELMIGSRATETGKPQIVSVNDNNELVFYPIPDAEYTIRGRYRKSPQSLSADNEVPEMPAEFHAAIKWRALMFMGVYDEATRQNPEWERQYDKLIAQLTSDQLPMFNLGGPLA